MPQPLAALDYSQLLRKTNFTKLVGISMKKFALIPFLCTGLVACGGSGSSGSSDTAAVQNGVFIDSPVVNIGYRTQSQEGVTSSSGEYSYVEGETVTFFIGDLELPPVSATGVVTPLDLAGATDTSNDTVINIIRLLQTLDEDGDADNGITITEIAKNNATQVNFELSVQEFEASTAVTSLVANSGSTNTALISEGAAIAHFEDTLAEEGLDFVANANISGVWTTNLTDNELLAFVFFQDGTYVHLEVDEEAPIDSENEISGMEWGTYVRDSETGELDIEIRFDNNGDTGLTDAANGQTTIFAQVAGDTLTLQFDDNQNGTIGTDEELDFTRTTSSGLSGVWSTDLTDNELLAFVFFDDGTYAHLEVDEVEPFDQVGETSGMEFGTIQRNQETGQLTVTIDFDNNGDTGLTDNVDGSVPVFAQIDGDVLTLQFDDNQNGTIDEDETLNFERR